MNKHWRKTKLIFSIALNVLLILALVIPHSGVQAASYNVDYEDPTECGLASNLVTKSLITHTPTSPVNFTDKADYTVPDSQSSTPYWNWQADYNYSTVNSGNLGYPWVSNRRYEEQRGWSGNWDVAWGFYGLTDSKTSDGYAATGCGWSMKNEVAMFSNNTSGMANSDKLHRRKISIPVGEYVTSVNLKFFWVDGHKIYINGKPYTISGTSGAGGHLFYGNMSDVSAFVGGNNLFALSLYNDVGQPYETGMQYDMTFTTATDAYPPKFPSDYSLTNWYLPNTVLAVAATDTGGSGVAHTYASYDGENFYRADGSTYNPYDRTNWINTSINGRTVNVFNFPTSTNTNIPAADRAAFTSLNVFNTFKSGALTCLAEDRSGRWSSFTSCGTIDLDTFAPTITFSYKAGNPLGIVASFSDANSGVKATSFKATLHNTTTSYTATDCTTTSCSVTVPAPGGQYDLSATATDNAGNSVTTPGMLYPENVLPSAPTLVSPGVVPTDVPNNILTNKNVTFFSWGASTDSGGSQLKGYDVAVQTGTATPTTRTDYSTTTSYTINPPITTSGTHSFWVRAVDNAGNVSAWVKTFTHIFDNDQPTTPGTISETKRGIQSGIATTYNDPLFTWGSSTDPSASPIKYDTYWQNNACGTAPTPTAKAWNAYMTPPLQMSVQTNGTWCLWVYAVDQAGNYAQNPVSFTYIYQGGYQPVPVITSITVPTASPVTAYANADGTNWTLIYGPTFSGAITVNTQTGLGSIGQGILTPAAHVIFPNVFNIANPTAVPVDGGNAYQISTAHQDYVVNTSMRDDAVTKYIELDTPGGYIYTHPGIQVIREATSPQVTNVTLTATNGYANGTSLYVSNNTSNIVVKVFANDIAGPGGKSIIASATCPAAFGLSAPSGQITSDPNVSGGYVVQCAYSGTLTIPTVQTQYTIRVYDNFGNSTDQTITAIPDITDPNPPTVDVPDHPGITFFASWTVASDNSGGSGVRQYQVLSSTSTSCTGSPKDIANVTKIELVTDSANPYFCVRAVDQVGNPSDWASALVGSIEGETFYHAFDGVTAIERRDANNPEDLTYTIADHLGSASMTVRADGSVVSNVRYLPYGQERWTDVDAPGDRGFTGQRNETGFGLMDYNARYYSPALGRFLSPDTIIPDLQDARSLDRYAYSNNNPINYTDPSGHWPIPNPIPPIDPNAFLQGAADYFENLGYSVVGSVEGMLAKGANANGADLVVKNAVETIAVECKQLTSGNVNLGTLGKNELGERGGSINQVISTAQRLKNTSVSQLQMEFDAVKDAYSNGTLKNALYTNAENASKTAKDVFNYVYVAAANGAARVIKGAQDVATKTPETMFFAVPYFMIDPKNSPLYNPQIQQ